MKCHINIPESFLKYNHFSFQQMRKMVCHISSPVRLPSVYICETIFFCPVPRRQRFARLFCKTMDTMPYLRHPHTSFFFVATRYGVLMQRFRCDGEIFYRPILYSICLMISPFFITKQTSRKACISWNGFFGVAMISAHWPAATAPRSS